MQKVIIDSSGVRMILTAMLLAKLFTPQPRMLAVKAGTAAWIVVLLSGLVGYVGYLFLAALLERFPGKNIAEISTEVLGKGAGSLFCLLYAAYFIFVAGIMFRQFGSGFRIAILPTTPISAMTMVGAVIALFAASRGLEPLMRMASYVMPMLLLLWGLTLAGTVRHMEPTQYAPWFGFGLGHTLLLSLPESSLYSEILGLGVLAGYCRPKDVRKIGTAAIFSSAAILCASYIVLEGAFPYPALSRLFFPMLDLTRLIEVSEFLQRLEALFVFLWVFVAALKISMALIAAGLLISHVAALSDYRPLLPILTLLCFTISFIPINVAQLAAIDSDIIRTWSWPFSYGLPALTLAVAALRGKRGASHGGEPAAPAG